MTYLNRHTDNDALLSFVQELPRILRRGVDYWAIFAGAFTDEEYILLSKAHFIDGPAVECRLEWYIQNNHFYALFKKLERDGQECEKQSSGLCCCFQ